MAQNAPSKIHVVTRAYLAGWALPPHNRLRPVNVKYGDQKPKTPAGAGWVDQWWGEGDPALNETCEQVCQKLEGLVPDLLRTAEERWPFSDDRDRALLAQFIALHGVRNDAMKTWFEDARENSLRSISGRWDESDSVSFDQFAAHHRSDAERARKLLTMTNKLASSLASMHWTLLRFAEPIVITSDHPVCPVPRLGDGEEVEVAAMPAQGWGNIVEFRFPLTPRLVLLGSWHLDDESDKPLDAHWNDAAAINAVLRAQAQRQWFRVHPGPIPAFPGLIFREVDRSSGPIAPGLLPGYSTAVARQSPRRIEVVQQVERLIESEDDKMIFVARPQISRPAA